VRDIKKLLGENDVKRSLIVFVDSHLAGDKNAGKSTGFVYRVSSSHDAY